MIAKNWIIKVIPIAILLVCALFSTSAGAQPSSNFQIRFKHLTNDLSNSTITCIFQDSYGYMWIGTRNGLNRFDGVNVKVYGNTFNDTTSLSDNYVRCIFEDKEKNLWVGTNFGGINVLLRDKDVFKRYHSGTGNGNLSDNAISGITEDDEGNVWIGTMNGGVNVFDPISKSFSIYKHHKREENSLSNNNISFVYKDLSGNIWVGTEGGGLNLYDKKNESFTSFQHDVSDNTSISGDEVISIHQSNKDRIWIGTRHDGANLLTKDSSGNFVFENFRKNEKDPNSVSHNTILSIMEDSQKIVWMGTENGGLNRYDPATSNFDHYYYNPNDKNSISNNSIWTIYEDNAKMLWFGTYNQGINLIDTYSNRFKHFDVNIFEQLSINNGNVTSFYEEENGDLWVGTDGGGLNYYNAKEAKFTYYRHDPDNDNSIGSDAVIGLYKDKDDNLWVGTWNGGLNLFDRNSKTFKRFIHDKADVTSIAGNNIYSVCEDSKGRFWVGTFSNQLDLFNPETNTFTHLVFSEDEVINTRNVFTLKIFEDRLGYLWLCTETGLVKLLIDDDFNIEMVKYTYNEKDPNGLSNNLVHAIFEDSANNLWVGTGNGLNLYDRATATFKTYRTDDGLPSNVVYSIQEDNDQNLWLSTSHGLSKFNVNKESFRNYEVFDGLQSNEFLRNSCFKNKDGLMYFGGINGFNVFNPESVRDNPFIPPVYIVGLRIDNEEITTISQDSPLSKYITDTDLIKLNYNQSNFGFDFAALNYSQAEKNQYRYWLEGFDNGWKDVKGLRSANYSKVPPGTYTFWVKGSNNDRLWNPEMATIKIIISPPFWNTWWAHLIYIISAIAIIYWLYKNIVNRERLQSNLQLERTTRENAESLHKAKIQFFTNLSHELRTPLTLIIGPMEKLISLHEGSKFMREQLYVINQNAHRLLRLVNQLLDFRKAESGNLQLKVAQGNIVNFIREIILSFQGFAAQKKIELIFSGEFDDIQVYYDRDQLEKVLYNLISNALKYTHENGQVVVKTSWMAPGQLKEIDGLSSDHALVKNGFVELVVRDNGIGIAFEHQEDIFKRFFVIEDDENHHDIGTGIGLSLVKTLVEMHHGIITVDSELGEYTEFKIKLPLGKDFIDEKFLIKDFKNSEDIINYGHVFQEEVPENDTFLHHPLVNDNVENEDLPILLVIEDNADVRNYITSVFEAEYKLYESTNGVDAFELAKEIIPDLIISDVMMPKMDGITLCHKLKQELKTSHVPIILLTARTSLIFKIEGFETGADDYITKPFNANLLKVRARNLITSRKILREHFLNNDGVKIEPTKVAYTSKDELFLNEAMKIVENNMSNSEFTVEELGKEVGMSRMQLYRKLKSLTGFSANEFIRLLRLKRAAQLLQHNDLTVSEITYDVGFTDLQYFRSCFKKQFGMNPSEYSQQMVEK